MKLNSRSILILVSFIIFFQIHQGVFGQVDQNILDRTMKKHDKPFGRITGTSISEFKKKYPKKHRQKEGSIVKRNNDSLDNNIIISSDRYILADSSLKEKNRSGTDWVLNTLPIIVPPSSNSSALIKESSLSVDNYTGRANYNIPLFDLKSYNINLPIYLSYSSNGIRVDEIASWVGLGWTLHSGGCITRIMNGLPDEFLGTIHTLNGYDLPAYGYLHLYDHPTYGFIDISDFGAKEENMQQRIIRNANWQNLSGDEGPNDLGRGEGWDISPDEFYFNFPGYSGKFVFTQAGEIITIPHQNFKIIKFIQPVEQVDRIVKFEVQTPDGYKYIFGGVEDNYVYIEESINVRRTRMVRYQYDKHGVSEPGVNPPFLGYFRTPSLVGFGDNSILYIDVGENSTPFNSTWQLRTIVSPNNDYINFSYRNQEHADYYITGRNEQITMPNLDLRIIKENDQDVYLFASNQDDNLGIWHPQEVTFIKDLVITSTKILTSIETKSGNKVIFNTSSEFREDMLDAEKLESIVLKDDVDNTIKMFKFEQSYSRPEAYVSKDHYILGDYNDLVFDFFEYDTDDPYETDEVLVSEQKRMFLTKLVEYDKNLNVHLPAYNFEYNSTPLPRRASYRTDKFGYYNNNNRGTKLPKITYTGVFGTDMPGWDGDVDWLFIWDNWSAEDYCFEGAIQEPDEAKAQAGTLIKVITPNGGTHAFQYELNTNGVSNICGLRVKSLREYPSINDDSQFLETNYLYHSSGASNSLPRYNEVLEINSINAGYFGCVVGKTINYWSTPINSPALTKGNTVGYKKVQVQKLGGGSTFYYFTNPTGDMVNTPALKYKAGVPTPYTAGFPYVKGNDNDWKRGVNTDVINTNIDEVDIVDKTNNIPEFNPEDFNIKISYGLSPRTFKSDCHDEGNACSNFYAGIYKYQSGWYYKDKTTETVFSSTDPGDESKAVVNQVDYDYKVITHDDLQYTFLDSQTELNSKSQPQEITYTYPLDISDPSDVLTTQPVIDELISKHMLSTILKTEKSNNYKKVEGQINTYRVELNEDESTMILPSITNLLEGEAYKPKVYYDKYDDKGNIIEYHEKDNYYTTFLWGYNYQYPIAKIENAEYSYVIGQLNNITYIDLQSKTSEQLVNIFNTLRQKPEMAGKNIYSYTYDPLIGMTSETDPNGNTLKYIYDDFNRLETITDKEDMVLKHVDYHYFEAILEANPASFIIENDGGTFSVAITSNLHWAVSENSDWVSIIPPTEGTNDGSFQFVCSKNTVPSARSSEITLAGSGISKTISITQLEGDYITVSPSQLCEMILSGADGCEFTIDSNIEWTATINDGSDFFSFYPPSGSGQGITFNIDSNGPVQSPQTGSVVISGNGISKVITVTQGHQ